MKKEKNKKLSKSLVPTIFSRLLILTLLVSSLFVTKSIYAQGIDKISVEFKENSLVEVFSKIENITSYKFTYNSELLNKKKHKVSKIFKNKSLNEILDFCLENTNFTFEIMDNKNIVIREKTKRDKYKLWGKVVDEENTPMPGVTIIIEKQKTGFATGIDGNFNGNSSTREGMLTLSFIGYKTMKVPFQSGKEIIVKMQKDISDLGDVTVIAYGERNKRELIGSISSVKGDAIKEIPSSSLANLLQGRMAGVEITNQSGAPGGGGAVIAIRGYNSLIDQNTLVTRYGEPLYVIDGVPVQGFTSPITGTNTLSSIDPTTIESIEVLKDAASAAIYGSRAGNGVILITTKKGREGNAKFSVNASYSLSLLPESPEQTGGIAARRYALKGLRNMKRPYRDQITGISHFADKDNLPGFVGFGAVNDHFYTHALRGFRYNPADPRSPINSIVQDSLNPFYNNSTDWYKYAFRPGEVINANIQASGGGEKMNYLIGTGIFNEKGIAYGSDFTRVNFLSNIRVTPIRNMNLDARFQITYMGRHRGQDASSSRSAQQIERLSVDPRSVSSFLPGGGYIEKKLLEVINTQLEKNENYDLRASIALNYEILPGLNIRLNGSVNYGLQMLDVFRPKALSNDKLSTSRGEIFRNLTALNENLLTYKKSFDGGHNIDLIAGLSFEKNRRNTNVAAGYGSASDKVHYIYKGFPEIPSADIKTERKILQNAYTDMEEWALLSYFARAAYNYKQKYLIETTIRQDGSSIFGSNNKYATFPAVALGWAFSEESFVKNNLWWMSYGKIRASWGRSGDTFYDPYRAHGLLIPGGEFLGRPLLSPDNSTYGGMINRDLKWVIHDQYDLGFDIDILDYRYKLKLDYYYRWSTGVLSSSKLPKTLYLYENQWLNANNVSNEGIEFEFQADIIRTHELSWRMNINAAHNWNRLIKTFDNRDIGLGNGIAYHMLGRPLYMLYTFEDGKIYGSNNDIPYVYDVKGNKHKLFMARNNYPFDAGMRSMSDLTGDNEIAYNDQVYQGTTLPVVHGGWANEIRYKNFDVSILFTYSLGRHMINSVWMESLDPSRIGSDKPYLLADISKLKFWEKAGDENIEGILPKISPYEMTMAQYESKVSSMVEKVNYIKLKTITIGYNLPKEWSKKVNLSNVRIFATGENLFTITNYSGMDPEVVSINSGIDQYREYPLARKITLGLTINF